jgi:hypothetical protein
LRELYGHVRTGHIYLVDVDIAKFFDTIPHEPLIDATADLDARGGAAVCLEQRRILRTSYATDLHLSPSLWTGQDTRAARPPYGDTRSVRRRANVQAIDGDVNLAVAAAARELLKYTAADEDSHADEMLT